MTDYFALFQQPRRPWLDLENLEEKYRDLARATHPDQSSQPGGEFTEVNKAYRILREPKSRLHHLLTLAGNPPSNSTTDIPADLSTMFMRIAPALASNNSEELNALTEELRERYNEALDRLHRLDDSWSADAGLSLDDARNLYHCFAFLTRWKNLLEEHRFNDSIPSR